MNYIKNILLGFLAVYFLFFPSKVFLADNNILTEKNQYVFSNNLSELNLIDSEIILAQSKIIPQGLLSSKPSEFKKYDNVDTFIILAINIGTYLFSFIGALALLVFVYGGVILILSQGRQEKIKQGTGAMTAAVIGLVIAFSAYALIAFLSKSIGVESSKRLNLKTENQLNKNT